MENLVLSGALAQNRVLRNTYWLLALSLLPTALGAWAGVSFGLAAFMMASPGISLLLFLVVAFGLIYAIHATKESGAGVAILLLFTAFMGAMMSPLLGQVLSLSNGVKLITLAAGSTAGIFAVMGVLATTIKRDISGWGKFLFVGLIGLIVAMVANIWLQLPALALTLSAIAVMLFSAYLLFDLKRVIDGGETNYITATLAIYLDLINIFQNLLYIFGVTSGDD